MTVSSATSRADYTGNGSTTAFTVPFYFVDNSHIKVYRTVIATGVTTTLVEGTDYTLTGAGVSSGGTVTTTSAPTSAQKISILRNMPFTQNYHYVPNDPFPAASHETALDIRAMEVQQVNESMTRSIKLSATNTMTSTEFTVTAANRANKVLGFDAAGELTVAQGIGDYKGNWAAGVSYNSRDMAKDSSNNNLYICNTAHTSSGSLPISTNTDAGKWDILVDASGAAASASSASASASAAATSASNASTSASNASTSASAASTSAANALASYNAVHNQYYGSASSDPSTRPDSSASQTGDLYFNTTISGIKAYSGSGWVVAYNTGGGSALIAANNLSDVPNAATARNNLGLGALATVTPGTGVATAAAAAVNATGGFITYTTYAPASGKTLTVSNSLTLAGTDGTVMTFPGATDTIVGLAATQTLTNKTLTNPTINNYVEGVVAIGNSGTTQTLSLTSGTVQTVTMTGNCTFTMPTATAGKSFILILVQDATGSRTATFTSVKWPAGTAPTLTTTASTGRDIIAFFADGTNWYGSYVQAFA